MPAFQPTDRILSRSKIAKRLNADHIAPPRGKAWNASTINGNGKRGNGILRNEIYAGRLIWNKVAMVKDPDTGKRVSRPNPPAAWLTTEVPDLAMVPTELFEAAQARIEARRGARPETQRRAKHLLTGLLRAHPAGAECPFTASPETAVGASGAPATRRAGRAPSHAPSTSTQSRPRCLSAPW